MLGNVIRVVGVQEAAKRAVHLKILQANVNSQHSRRKLLQTNSPSAHGHITLPLLALPKFSFKPNNCSEPLTYLLIAIPGFDASLC